MHSVVFICHHSGRTGAPLVLLHLLRWLKANTHLRLEVVLRGPGELQADLASVSSVFIAPKLPRLVAAVLRRTIGPTKLAAIEDLLLRRKIRRLAPSLIYANTITNTREVIALAPLGVPILCHVHEMEYWIRHELGIDRAAAIAPFVRRFIAAGPAVSKVLNDTLGIDPKNIDVVDVFSLSDPPPVEGLPAGRIAARRELAVPDNTFLVGACGTVDWRKGVDLFLAVVRALAQQDKEKRFRFLWIGGPVTGKFFDQLQHDIANAELSDRITFAGAVPSPEKYYAALDAFLVTSREDCGPMVMMEAAGFEVPILCFERSGGAPTFVAEGAGIAVPYLDVHQMAQALLTLGAEPALQRQLARAARDRVALRHTVTTQLPALYDAMLRAQPLLATAARTKA